MTHLDIEALSSYMDGAAPPEVGEHLAGCAACHEELKTLVELRGRLRELPTLEPPPDSWAEIERRLPHGRGRFAGLLSARRVRQVAGIAAVFLAGFGVGRLFLPDAPISEPVAEVAEVAEPPEATRLVVGDPSDELDEAMAEVQRRGVEYERALRRLERIARDMGTPMPRMAEQELAVLDALVEASRRGVEVEPSDPVLNAYLFAALDRRADVIRQVGARAADADEGTVWR